MSNTPRQFSALYFHFSSVLVHQIICPSAYLTHSATVGYQQENPGVNLNMMMPDFVAVSGEGIDIQTLIPEVPSGKTLKSGDFVIQYYNSVGIIETSYYYLLADDTEEEEMDGWWDDALGNYYSTKKFGQGEGFILNTKQGGAIVYSGAVDGAEFEMTTRQDLSHQGNIRPASVDIQTLIPQVPSGKELKSGDFVIQYYDSVGIIDHSYYYILADDTEEEEMDGWWDDALGKTYSTKVFAPGEGFYMNTKQGGKVIFPTLSF